MNNGTCFEITSNCSFTCHCTPEFTGALCSQSNKSSLRKTNSKIAPHIFYIGTKKSTTKKVSDSTKLNRSTTNLAVTTRAPTTTTETITTTETTTAMTESESVPDDKATTSDLLTDFKTNPNHISKNQIEKLMIGLIAALKDLACFLYSTITFYL